MKKRNAAGALLFAFALFFVMNVTGKSLAYYTVTGTATNVVTSGIIQLAIHEQTEDGKPFPEDGVEVKAGEKVDKKVTVENICAQPFYLRIKLVNGIEDSNLSTMGVFDVDLNTADWTQRADGYIYYNEILQPGQTTSAAFTQVELVKGRVSTAYEGKVLTLTVTAEAVQSKNNPADHPWEASGWPEAEGGQV